MVGATVKLSAAFLHDESSIRTGGYKSAIAPKIYGCASADLVVICFGKLVSQFFPKTGRKWKDESTAPSSTRGKLRIPQNLYKNIIYCHQ